jgi:hypothetical protein
MNACMHYDQQKQRVKKERSKEKEKKRKRKDNYPDTAPQNSFPPFPSKETKN